MAIVAAVCCAFATKPDPYCVDFPQYYLYNNNQYIYAGYYGWDYDCDNLPGVPCTYYQPDPVGHPNDYVMCHEGNFIAIPNATKRK